MPLWSSFAQTDVFRGGEVASGGSVSDINVGGIYYRVHQFTTVGTSTFKLYQTKSLEMLIVAGGGGAGTYGGIGYSGGGGGGGLLSGTLSNVTPQNYSVVVGAAAVGGTQTNGGNSSFSTYISYGGGYGGATYSGNGGNGGSGGGPGAYTNPSGASPYPGAVGLTTQTSQGTLTGYGRNGIQTDGPDAYGSGSGGGAGSTGPLYIFTSSITGTSQNYAGGGSGAWNTNPRPGELVHYGKGATAGGTGAGQGIVIIRYRLN